VIDKIKINHALADTDEGKAVLSMHMVQLALLKVYQ
jgi:hypothetical protein